MEKQNNSIYDRFTNWINSSISIKMATIGFLVLILMIPLAMIDDVIRERSYRQQEVVSEISQTWSSSQIINGPIVSIPFQTYSTYTASDGKIHKDYHDKVLQILPEELNISGPIDHDSRKRGIYEVTVYETGLDIQGNFIRPEIDVQNLHEVRWDDAFITIGITDMKGIKDEIDLVVENSSLEVEPGTLISDIIRSGITAKGFDWSDKKEGYKIPFSIKMNIRGSKSLQFIPLGKTTEVKLQSSWSNPSFIGEYITNSYETSDAGFEADWKILHLNRNYPQHWINNDYADKLYQSAFGVEMFNSVDDYQSVTRASKYGMMTIALTFLVFFLVEIMNKKRIHPLQYILVGIGLSLFYTLLVSITEHSSFTFAYLIAASSIITMVFLYSLAIFKDSKLSFGLLTIMLTVYAFVFVTLQLVDYALLIGSIGLTLILALTMYLTRNIDWFNIGKSRLDSSTIKTEMT